MNIANKQNISVKQVLYNVKGDIFKWLRSRSNFGLSHLDLSLEVKASD